MKVVTLSGWAQPADSLETIAPGAMHADYAKHADPHNVLEYLGDNYSECDVIIGWSLGGQLALRALAEGNMRAKALVLIAAPFQYVNCDKFMHGMGSTTYGMFRESYAGDPVRTSQRFAALIAKGDKHMRDILPLLDPNNTMGHDVAVWFPWLKYLAAQTMREYDFDTVPPTLVIHGSEDVVTSSKQAEALHSVLPSAKLEMLEGCGHAPHLHDKERIIRCIEAHVRQHGI